MTVQELEERMTVSEIFDWIEYFNAPSEPEQATAPEILSAFGLK